MFDAVSYANNATCTLKHALQFLQHCKTYFKWKDNEEILEIGCADGRITKQILYPFLEKHLKHLDAVDIDNEAINVANSGNDKHNLKFSVMNIENQELVNAHQNKYDHIFAFYVLHLVSPKLWPENLFSMTKPGGQVFASILLAPNIYSKTIELQMIENNKPWSKYFEDYKDILHSYYENNPCEVVTEYLTNVGFIVDMARVITIQGDFDSKEALQRTLLSADTISSRLPIDIREAYANDFGGKMMKHAKLNNDTGTVCVDFNILIFVASKP